MRMYVEKTEFEVIENGVLVGHHINMFDESIKVAREEVRIDTNNLVLSDIPSIPALSGMQGFVYVKLDGALEVGYAVIPKTSEEIQTEQQETLDELTLLMAELLMGGGE